MIFGLFARKPKPVARCMTMDDVNAAFAPRSAEFKCWSGGECPGERIPHICYKLEQALEQRI